MSYTRENTILLFDVDGTLTVPMKPMTEDMRQLLQKLRKYVRIAAVGGSDFKKQEYQLGKNCLEEFDFVFSENGLVCYENGKLRAKQSMKDFLGEENLKKILNTTMKALAETDSPFKRGTFIEYRTGMLNVAPAGRQLTDDERAAFAKYDKEHKVREKLVATLSKSLAEFNLRFVIGGQISIDVFPEGWDKTYCLRFIDEKVKNIHFFGDKTFPGGNDYEIYSHKRCIGHSVKDYKETMKILTEMFKDYL